RRCQAENPLKLLSEFAGPALNITITPSGTEKIQGRSSWKIAGDTGSIFLRPIAGIGYVR
ncbi:hypothetical protein, partial [Bradyrhizobium diazoefficiens]|uniref:hypothetical protein n=1 Tax=Bradyrhizobium diazoefficiens TaxID=1355477 RepID=UPI001AECA4CA